MRHPQQVAGEADQIFEPERLEAEFGAELTWLPFDLHPEYPPEGIPRAQLHARYGDTFHERLKQWFERDGLVYNPPPEVVTGTGCPSTRKTRSS